MKRRLAVAVMALALVGCSAPEEGTVVEMEYDDPDTWTTPGRWSGTGESRRYTQPRTHHDDECYQVTLELGDDRGSRCISPAEWNALEIGDYYEPKGKG